MAIGSLILGILAILVSFIPFLNWIGIPVAIAGIVFGAIGGKKLKEQGSSGGIATAGLVLSIIALVLAVLWTLMCGACAACATAPLMF